MNSLAIFLCRVLSFNSVPQASLLLAPCKRSQYRNLDCCCGGRHGNVRFQVIKRGGASAQAVGRERGRRAARGATKPTGPTETATAHPAEEGGVEGAAEFISAEIRDTTSELTNNTERHLTGL